MKAPLRSVLLVLATAALTLPTDPAGGFSYFVYGSQVVVWSNHQSLRYMSPSTFPPGGDTDILYLNALGLWMLVPSANFQYSYYHLPEDYEVDHYDGYSDTVAVSADELDPGVLAETWMVNNGARWYDMDMLFSDYPADGGWSLSGNPSCAEISDPASYGISFLLVATHELGHALGLGHDPQGTEPPGTTWFIGTMNPRYPAGGPIGDQAIIEVHADDRNGVRYLYPHSGQTQPVVDLANPGYGTGQSIGQAVPATFSPATIYPGQVVTLQSVIENFGNVNLFNVSQGFYLSTDEYIDTDDVPLGALAWDIAYGDGFEFAADADMPADLAAGTYYVGSYLDDLNEVPEEYEDNNIHVYCQPLTIGRLAPAINTIGGDLARCGHEYVGPAPTVTHPLNMAPLTWSVDNPQPGMWIEAATGRVHWPSPVRSLYPYTVVIRATNTAGTDTEILFLGVDQGPPQIRPIADQSTPHTVPYVGPTPVLSDPPCMNPILNWSLDGAPAGVQIDHATGVVTWDRPLYSYTPYTISVRATNAIGNGIVTWHLRVTGLVGDLNCDGNVSFGDINPFVAALSNPALYASQYPNCDRGLGDCNHDGQVGFGDINPFVALLSGG
jgi:hypothetical protein